MSEWFSDLKAQFILNFIDDDRWRYLLDGLGVTLEITFFALLIGLTIGIIVAIIRATHDNTIETMNPGLGKVILKILNTFSKIYLTVVRGTPVVVQLLIMYYIIFATSNNKIIVAVIAFGVNSGAYVAEIVRSGIMSIDKGQMEAGRSLGFNYVQTMISIIIPQAFKNVLPALANEFITLLKETSVSGYIALQDLTKGAYIIIGRTYSAFMPLIAVALIYLTLVMFFTWLVGKLERRLRNSDH
ncbi:MAG: amino acid ABC transporter permease [Clostridia bacterium]